MMDTSRRFGPPAETVLAAQQGDQSALDELLSFSLPLVYNIVGRALRGNSDTDDLVQETMLRIVRGVPQIRDPEAFRSWIVAVTIRQIRWHQADLARAPRITALEWAPEPADPQADFTDLCILRLGLTGQRREVAEATRWLDEADQELLSLWWLEAAGNLDRGELAAALELSSQHTAVRVQRMKQQLDISRAVVRALHRTPGCHELALVAGDWDRVPSPLWRKRLARHLRECQECGTCADDLAPVDGLLVGAGLVPVPLGLGLGFGSGTGLGSGSGLGTGPTRSMAERGASPSPSASPHQPAPGAARHTSRAKSARQVRRASKHWHAVSLGKVVAIASVTVAVTAVSALAVANTHSPAPAAVARPTATAAPFTPPPPTTSAPAPATTSPTPTPTPTPVRTTTAAIPPPVVVDSAKKGVSVWNFSGITAALAASGSSWYYTWGSDHQGITAPAGVQFVPMIWGAASATPAALSEVKSESSVLLGFNEPDMASQSNMTPQQALALWPKLMATGMTLGSPAVAANAATPGGWLDQFMQGARSDGYRVNFITVHWYGSDFSTPDAVSQLQSYLQAIYNRYGLPIWLTEYALIKFGSTTVYPTSQQQVSFITASTSMLQSLPYVQRYAWFALPATTPGQTGLFQPGGAPNSLGVAYEHAGG